MRRLRLLVLCCRAGGCSVGYSRAGFDVVGVDIDRQPDYPFEFHQADAFAYAPTYSNEYDVIHASPHCQGYSAMRFVTGKSYGRDIDRFREMLEKIGKPYIIENVVGAPLADH